VLKDHNGYFSYYFNPTKPPNPKVSPTPKTLLARSCPYCQIYIGPGNDGSGGPAFAGGGNGNGGNMNGTSYPPLQVACETGSDKGPVVENPISNGVLVGDQIFWVSSYPGNPITVTTPANMCSGGQSGTTFAAEQICTVTGAPGTTYSYTVQMDKCPGTGSSTLTINPTPPSPRAQ
jgi:hypothetical protein